MDKLTDVTWLFLLMASLFGDEWLKRYPPKRTRVMKAAKTEWARVIKGYSRDELRDALRRAKGQSVLPPSTIDFWKLLESRRVRSKRADQQKKQRCPPNRGLGAGTLKSAKDFLAK